MVNGDAGSLYVGRVMHRRLRPRGHRLCYRVFSLLLDLDAIDGLASRLKLFSRNRFNLFAFFDHDHGARTGEALRLQVEGHLRAAGLESDGGPIRLLTMPRILGYAFNPLSIYFCHRRNGALLAVLYEVSNTFGERHTYLFPATTTHEPIRQKCGKGFYVSPFLDMELTYDFRLVPPAERFSVSITASDAHGPILAAVHAADRRPLSDAALLRAFLTTPLLTLKVIAGIHWEALRIWLKGVGLRDRPPAPERAVTIVHVSGS